MAPDARTTPRWLQLPGLIFLLLLSGYFLTAYAAALGKDPPQVVREHPYAFWFGTWQMFTLLDRRHSVLESEVLIDGAWQPLELETLFPYRWESGPRYERSSFWSNRARLRVLAHAACTRLEDQQGISAEQLRFHSVRWGKTLGSQTQPRKKAKTEELLVWTCGQSVSLPKGRRL
jgi:hypothetical protein